MAHLFRDQEHLTKILDEFTEEDRRIVKGMHEAIHDEEKSIRSLAKRLKKIDDLIDTVMMSIDEMDKIVDKLKTFVQNRKSELKRAISEKEELYIELDYNTKFEKEYSKFKTELRNMIPNYNRMMRLFIRYEESEDRELSVYHRLTKIHNNIKSKMTDYYQILLEFKRYFEFKDKHKFEFKLVN